MKREGFRQRILSVFVILIFVIVLLCFSEKNAEEIPDGENLVISETEAGSENAILSEEESGKDDGKEAEKSRKEDIMSGSGIKSEKTLSEDVVRALKNGDIKFLTGIEFGEKFDYDRYSMHGNNEYYAKGALRTDRLYYFFDGKGHRFSGFSYSYTDGCKSFLGIEARDPVSILLEAFGGPDACEEWYEGLRADWYFEKAVLTLYESDAEIRKIEYKALGDAADGDGVEIKSDFEKRMEHKSEYEKAEVVYCWGIEAGEEDVCYELQEDEHDAEEIDGFVENYLREQGFGEKAPDSVSYDSEGQKLGEEYIDDEKGRYCFIMYGSGGITCAVRDADEAVETGYLMYSCNEEGEVIQETQYDAWGMRMAEASYKFYDGVPFPFLTEDWNLNEYDNGIMTYHLCRNQKTWFPEKNAWINDKGRVKTISESDISDWKIKSYFNYFDTFQYRADGKLDVIQEEIPLKYLEEPEGIRPDILERPYFGEMEFQYDRNGTLKKIDYFHSDWDYGTWDQSGYIDFDKRGRMVHNQYYVTHGYHSKFYFYHEEEERPQAVAGWCWGNGFEDISVYRPLEEL